MVIVYSIIAVIVLFFAVGAFASRKLKVKHFEISDYNAKVMRGFKIVLLSDLHGRFIGKNQEKLVKAILDNEPDLVVFAGDMVDAYDKNAKAAKVLAEQLKDKAKIIAVRGNHFYKVIESAQEEMENAFSDNNITTLKNQRKLIDHNDIQICIDGLDDPITQVGWKGIKKKEALKRNRVALKNAMDKMLEENVHSDYKILICHRPTDVDLFERAGYDLALCGHTHGGQWALPGGLEVVGDEVTFFPKKNMQSGLHYHNKMPLVITSGIGYSNIKLRTFLPPEIAIITFK